MNRQESAIGLKGLLQLESWIGLLDGLGEVIGGVDGRIATKTVVRGTSRGTV
jgi:hypothetical protein